MSDIAKFTPGPWKVSGRRANGTASYVDCAAGYTVAQTYSSPSAQIPYCELWAEAEANAHLVAAVTELYEAALAAEANFGWLAEIAEDPEDMRAVALLRAALSKARGEA